VLLIGGAIIAAIALWPATAGSQGQQTSAAVLDVKVEAIEPVSQQPDEMRLPAVLEAYRVVKVAAEVPGRIEKIGPQEGTDVEPNQPLVWVNTDLLKAACDQAVAQYELNVRELKRYETLDGRGVATDIELYRAKAAVAVSEAALTQTREQLARAVIRSPIAGVLNDIIPERGEYVVPGMPVAEIVQVDQLKAVVCLPERDVVHVKVGQKSRVVVDAVDGLELDGTVTYISAKADEASRTFRTEITADNRQRRARAGQIVRLRLLRRNIPQAIMIPLLSVIPTEDGYQVYVVEDDKAKARKVGIGVITSDRVQAISGLKAGDKLIVAGQRMVGDGSPVRVVR
jgi:membrane fusion protein (multidrug efflux system)